MCIRKGDLVRVRPDLEYGLGVRKEQLEYAGQEFVVEHECGYGYELFGNPFSWKVTDLELVKRGGF